MNIIINDPFLLLIVVILLFLLALLYYFLNPGRAKINFATPILDQFSRDLTAQALKGELDPIIGRRQEIDQLTRILSRRTKNNVILVGEAGVGKTAIVEGLAQNIVSGIAPSDLHGKRILSLDINALIAGTKYRGEFEERIKRITEEISRSQRTIILFIDEIHNLIQPEGSGESISLGDILKPAMARGELQIVGATTPQEYKSYFQSDPAFKRRLQPINISAPDEKVTLEILRGIKSKYEEYHGVKITDEALKACVSAGGKILPERSFPDKAIDLMDETASKVKLERMRSLGKNKNRVPEVTAEEVKKVIREYEEKSEK